MQNLLIILLFCLLFVCSTIQNDNFDGELTYSKLLEWGYNLDSRIITISNREIKSIESNTFNGFNNLEQLILSSNELTSITANIFNGLTALKILDLNFNMIDSIEDNAFTALENLEIFRCRYNALKEINENSLQTRTCLM